MTYRLGPLVIGWYDDALEWVTFKLGRKELVVDRRSTHRVQFSEREGLIKVHYIGPLTWRWRG